jgi:hypothetical protein
VTDHSAQLLTSDSLPVDEFERIHPSLVSMDKTFQSLTWENRKEDVASPIAAAAVDEALSVSVPQQHLEESSKKDVVAVEEPKGVWAGLKSETNNLKVHFKTQFWKEWELLKFYWKPILALAIATFFHSAFTKTAFWLYNHYQVYDQPILTDMLFKAFGKMDDKYRPIVEVLTFTFIGSLVIFGVQPFFVKKDYYAVHILHRYLLSTVVMIVGRVVAFTVTILPAPADHCNPSSPEYHPPENVVQIIFGLDVFNGCADLIYSGHTIFCTTVTLMYIKYGKNIYLKMLLPCLLLTNVLLIIALQNHYSVDTWLALWICPWIFVVLKDYIPDKKPQSLVEMEKAEEEANPIKRQPKQISPETKNDLLNLMDHLNNELSSKKDDEAQALMSNRSIHDETEIVRNEG